MRAALALLVVLAAAPAARAQALAGEGRVSVQAGWRLTPNALFYDRYYGAPQNADKARLPASPGGPVVAASFAYSVLDVLELGVDLFATGERLRLAGEPAMTTATYGGLVGLRLQTLLPLGDDGGLVPFLGVLAGPTLAFSSVEGRGGPQETVTQGWVGSAGATLRLDARWALTAEYRLMVGARGPSPYGSFNAGGSWLTVGLTWRVPAEPSRGSGAFP